MEGAADDAGAPDESSSRPGLFPVMSSVESAGALPAADADCVSTAQVASSSVFFASTLARFATPIRRARLVDVVRPFDVGGDESPG